MARSPILSHRIPLSISSWLLAVALGLAAGPAAAEQSCLEEAPVCLETVERGAFTSFSVSNRSVAPYSVRVQPRELLNLKPVVAPPFRAVLRPGESKVIGSLRTVEAGKDVRFRFEWRAALGDMQARHDDTHRYRIPFGGTQHRTVSQGYGGRFSHRGPSKYALDFGMPWGTPVLAARGGTVIDVVDGHIASSLQKSYYDKANRVVVLHTDGTFASYAHLRHGAVVSRGQRVATGDRIGLSGDSGYSGGPHLHFMVSRLRSDLTTQSLPVRFHDGTATGVVPARGVAFAPACASSGTGCAVGERPPEEASPPVPAARAPSSQRRDDGACICPNGAVIHVDLPCQQVCGR